MSRTYAAAPVTYVSAPSRAVVLLSQLLNGRPGGILEWMEENMADDGVVEFGPMKVPKPALLQVTVDTLKSFPDFRLNVVEALAEQADGSVTCVIEVTGTHTGDPFACMPGVEAIPATGKVVKNDPEKITMYFNDDQTKVVRQVVELLPGGRGFSGPPGLYLQIGGKLPSAPSRAVVLLSQIINGRPLGSFEWMEKYMADDFVVEFGPMKVPKPAVVQSTVDTLKSFPDFRFNVVEALAEQADGSVTCVVEATGTHTGDPFACMPGVEAVPATGKVVKNDPEKITMYLNDDQTQVVRQVVEPLPGGRGFFGPPGLYLQIGGKLPEPAKDDKPKE